MYRYILSYQPLNFKGNIDDFPLTIRYEKQVDAFREKFKDYLWYARFRDTLEAHVTVAGSFTRSIRFSGERMDCALQW